MKQELVLSVPKEIDKSKAEQILKEFNPSVISLAGYKDSIEEVKAMEISPEKCAKAKRVRLDLRKVRTDADKTRERLKEKSLLEGKAIQGVFNFLKLAISEEEETLQKIESHYELIEKERIQKIHNERSLQLGDYGIDTINMDLGNMEDEIFNNLLIGSKAQWQAVEDAKKKAEDDRIEEERLVNLYSSRKEKLIPCWDFLGDNREADFSALSEESFNILLRSTIEKKSTSEKKQSEYTLRLKALSQYGDFYDTSKLTIDSTENDFSQIIADAKFGRTAHLKEVEDQRLENENLKKDAEAKEKVRIAEEKKQAKIQADQKAKKEKESQRQNKMFELGFEYSVDSFTYEDINFLHTDLISMDNEKFEKTCIEAKSLKIKKDKELENKRLLEEEKQEAERLKEEKIQAEKDAQMEAETKRLREKADFEQASRLKLEQDQRKKEQDEEDRIAKEKEEAKKKALAPDKDKLIELAKTILSVNVTSQLAKDTIQNAHQILIDAVNQM